LNTLNFATKSSRIKNKVTVNEVAPVIVSNSIISRQKELQEWKLAKGGSGSIRSCGTVPSKRGLQDLGPLERQSSVGWTEDQVRKRIDDARMEWKQSAVVASRPLLQPHPTKHLVISDIDQLKQSTEQEMLLLFNSDNVKVIKSLKLIGKKRAADIMDAKQIHGVFTCLVDLQKAGLSLNQVDSIFKVYYFS
jgi:DNA uptake protein ComE-like DNA-binding protein